MKRIIILIVFVALVVGFIATSSLYVQQHKELTKLKEDVERAKRAFGGAEGTTYLFPIHRADYLFPTSPYGERISPWTDTPIGHQGIDLLGVWKARIVSVGEGIVVDHWLVPGEYKGKVYHGHPTYGAMIRVKHDDGSIALYAHLGETLVHEGQRVSRGQLIGRQGATGRAVGEHLHFELYVSDQLVNPLNYLYEEQNEAIPQAPAQTLAPRGD